MDLWFQISVTNSILVQYPQPVQDLSCNFGGVIFCNYPMGLHISTQIAVPYVFHGQVNGEFVFIPAEENDEALRILKTELLSVKGKLACSSGENIYVLHFHQYLQFPLIIDLVRLQGEFPNRLHGPELSAYLLLTPHFAEAADSELLILRPSRLGSKSGLVTDVGNSIIIDKGGLELEFSNTNRGGHYSIGLDDGLVF